MLIVSALSFFLSPSLSISLSQFSRFLSLHFKFMGIIFVYRIVDCSQILTRIHRQNEAMQKWRKRERERESKKTNARIKNEKKFFWFDAVREMVKVYVVIVVIIFSRGCTGKKSQVVWARFFFTAFYRCHCVCIWSVNRRRMNKNSPSALFLPYSSVWMNQRVKLQFFNCIGSRSHRSVAAKVDVDEMNALKRMKEKKHRKIKSGKCMRW